MAKKRVNRKKNVLNKFIKKTRRRHLLRQSLKVRNEILESADKLLATWEKQVRKELSDPLPDKYRHRRRPALRKFPFMDTGNQLDSIYTKKKIKVKKQKLVKLDIEAGIDLDKAPYAELTNAGKPLRDKGANPHWIGWLDDIQKKKGGRGQVKKSVVDIFDEIITSKKV